MQHLPQEAEEVGSSRHGYELLVKEFGVSSRLRFQEISELSYRQTSLTDQASQQASI